MTAFKHGAADAYDAAVDECLAARILAALEAEHGPTVLHRVPEVAEPLDCEDARPVGRDGATFEEIGAACGVSRERARGIVASALRAFGRAWRREMRGVRP